MNGSDGSTRFLAQVTLGTSAACGYSLVATERTDLDVAADFLRDEVLTMMAAVEARSQHPVARAIVEAAEQADIELHTANDFASSSIP